MNSGGSLTRAEHHLKVFYSAKQRPDQIRQTRELTGLFEAFFGELLTATTIAHGKPLPAGISTTRPNSTAERRSCPNPLGLGQRDRGSESCFLQR